MISGGSTREKTIGSFGAWLLHTCHGFFKTETYGHSLTISTSSRFRFIFSLFLSVGSKEGEKQPPIRYLEWKKKISGRVQLFTKEYNLWKFIRLLSNRNASNTQTETEKKWLTLLVSYEDEAILTMTAMLYYHSKHLGFISNNKLQWPQHWARQHFEPSI